MKITLRHSPFNATRRRAWLLWLALLLPLAHATALWHGYSHGVGQQHAGANTVQFAKPWSASADPDTAHTGACELCLAAAGVLSAGPLAQVACLPADVTHPCALSASPQPQWVSQLAWSPPARGPPADLI
jgi:hypothetical protein